MISRLQLKDYLPPMLGFKSPQAPNFFLVCPTRAPRRFTSCNFWPLTEWHGARRKRKKLPGEKVQARRCFTSYSLTAFRSPRPKIFLFSPSLPHPPHCIFLSHTH